MLCCNLCCKITCKLLLLLQMKRLKWCCRENAAGALYKIIRDKLVNVSQNYGRIEMSSEEYNKPTKFKMHNKINESVRFLSGCINVIPKITPEYLIDQLQKLLHETKKYSSWHRPTDAYWGIIPVFYFVRLKFHLARLDSTRLDTFDVSSLCILAVSS